MRIHRTAICRHLSPGSPLTPFKPLLEERVRPMNWVELVAIIQQELENAPRTVTSFGFTVQSWCMDSLEPTRTLLEQIQGCLRQFCPEGSIELVIVTQCEVVPTFISVTPHSIAKDDQLPTSHYWQNPKAQELFQQLIPPAQSQLVRQTLALVPTDLEKKTKVHWLCRLTQEIQSVQSFDAQALWTDINELNDHTLTALLALNWDELDQDRPTLFDLIQNPFSAACRALETFTATKTPKGGVYSIGAGQMVSILDYTRQLIDRGQLPLSTPLLADNRTFDAVAELRITGQRHSILNDLWINPQDRKPIAVHRDVARQSLIAKYQPAVIYLNVKAQALPMVMTPDFCRFLSQLPYTPILVMPSKSYTHQGETPFEWLHRTLSNVSPLLASQLIALGGFYAAPSILSGDHVHLTIAAQSKQPARTLAWHLVSQLPKNDETVRENNLQLEIIQGFDAAALLMAGGANKNFLTYTSARTLLRHGFELDHTKQPTWLRDINRHIEAQAAHNISMNEIIAKQLLAISASVDVPSPEGLKKDFIHCLPLHSQGIGALIEEIYRLFRHLLRTPADQRAAQASTRLTELVEHIRKDPQHLLGTRNARDGFIDEMLLYFFHAWQEHKDRIPLTLDFAQFYCKFYPKQWQGVGAQEGRNGILPVIVRASLMTDIDQVQWPSALDAAWNFYCPTPLPPVKPPHVFSHWHKYLFSLMQWVIEHSSQSLSEARGRERIQRWCETTRAQELRQVPQTLFDVEQLLQQPDLKTQCQRILRDCQYRDFQ